MKRSKKYWILYLNLFFFIFFYGIYSFNPDLDITISKFFYLKDRFISEELVFIKTIRTTFKYIMIFIPIISLIMLVFIFFDLKKKKYKKKFKIRRYFFVLLGFLIGPLIGCGLIANLYFKDTWGRARPVQIIEFNGDKLYTPPFTISDQCQKNCSWIGGEAAAAFSFFVGIIILKNFYFFFTINLLFGVAVSLCRMAMGGHFFSDNLFSLIFMIFLAYIYRYFFYIVTKKKLINFS